MVRHQIKGMNPVAKPLNTLLEQELKPRMILLRKKRHHAHHCHVASHGSNHRGYALLVFGAWVNGRIICP